MIDASLILDVTEIECTYGHIPNIPQAPDPRIKEIVFNKESDCQLLEDYFMDPVNEQCGTWLDYVTILLIPSTHIATRFSTTAMSITLTRKNASC